MEQEAPLLPSVLLWETGCNMEPEPVEEASPARPGQASDVPSSEEEGSEEVPPSGVENVLSSQEPPDEDKMFQDDVCCLW